MRTPTTVIKHRPMLNTNTGSPQVASFSALATKRISLLTAHFGLKPCRPSASNVHRESVIVAFAFAYDVASTVSAAPLLAASAPTSSLDKLPTVDLRNAAAGLAPAQLATRTRGTT